jgi:ribonuclease HI
MVKFVQWNMGKRIHAFNYLATIIGAEKIDIVAIQEPIIYKGKPKAMPGGRMFYSDLKPRACIWVKKDLCDQAECIKLSEFSSEDQAVVKLKIKLQGGSVKELIVSSTYFPGANDSRVSNHSVISEKLQKLVYACKQNRLELLLSADANAHHLIWGSNRECPRGRSLLEFITTNDLQILNVGNKPTFSSGRHESVIDISLSTLFISRRVEKWRVDGGETMSDHKIIRFEIRTDKLEPETFRPKKKTDWQGYRDALQKLLRIPCRSINNAKDLDKEAAKLTKSIIKAYHDNCKKVTNSRKCVLEWQSAALLEQRKNLRRNFNRAHKGNNLELREQYKKDRDDYKKACKKASLESWKKKVNEIENIKDCARLQKVLERKNEMCTGTLMRNDGTYTNSIEENNMELLTTHFPQCEIITNNSPNDLLVDEVTQEINEEGNDYIENIIKTDRIKWAVNSFSPFKAAGQDEIFPALLQKGLDLILHRLQELFRQSLRLGYIPKCWRGTLVAFIPKIGKPSYEQAKSYRPISLMSFVLKTLEKLIDRNMRENELKNNPIHPRQFAYQEGKGTETALHSLVTKLNLAHKKKTVALAVFIDIEGAFDNTSYEEISRAATEMRINEISLRWIKAMLKNREVKSRVGESKIGIKPTRGCPQGGCLSPILWCMVVNSLIIELTANGCHVTAYADDLALVVTAKNAKMACDLMNNKLKIVESWCARSGLHVNPAKTTMMRFTKLVAERKTKMKDVSLFNEKLKLSDEFKYLGVILDPKLSMKRHIDEATAKGLRSLWAAKAMVSRTWGLSPNMAMWLYKQVVLPRIMYGSVVWWHRAKIKSYADKLNSVQRLAMLMCTGAMKSTPTLALNVALDLSPIQIRAERLAVESHLRLKLSGFWECSAAQTEHGDIVNSRLLHNNNENTDKCAKVWNLERKFKTHIRERENWNHELHAQPEAIKWYSDGSKKDGKVGSGIYCPQLRIANSFRLSDHGTVMQAEMTGIKLCVDELIERNIMQKQIIIWSDSQAAIKAIENNILTSKTTRDCVDKLNILGMNNFVTIGWIPGHSGLLGNEIADKLANEGSEKDVVDIILTRPEIETERNTDLVERRLVRELWVNHERLNHSKMMMAGPKAERTKFLMNLTRRKLRVAIGILTGHCCLRKFLHRIGKYRDDKCRFCRRFPETMKHCLQECESLELSRLRILGIAKPDEQQLRSMELKDLISFTEEVQIFETFFRDE